MDASTLTRIRAEFPCLTPAGRGPAPVYLDTACMALKPRQVVRATQRYYEEFPACHGRTFHRFGRAATQAVDASRTAIRRFVGAQEDAEIIFLRNVTEGLNLLATCLSLGAGDTVITTGMEHNSNLLPWQRASRRRGFQHLIVPLTPEGELDQDLFLRALDSSRVRLVCTFHRSNVTGVTLPAEWIVDQAHKRGALVAFDGAQAAPHLPLDLRRMGADFYLFSLYKLGGPTGVAVLYGRRELLERIEPPNIGGEGVLDTTYEGYTAAELPDRLESGLQNYAGIVGSAAALQWLEGVGWEALARHDLALNRQLTDALGQLQGVRLVGPAQPEKRGSIVNFVLDGVDSIELAHLLDRSEGIMVRAGKHCAHSWYNAHGIPDSVRVSLYAYNTPDEVDRLIRVLSNIAHEFR
jgi:cysteine desulfurase/selenocysteine lyase